MPIVPLARAPFERKSIDIPTWDQWLTKLVTAVNDLAAGGGTYDAGNLTGTTLAPNVIFSSLTSVGTLTAGATGAGFTVNLGTSTIAGVLTVPNGGTGISTLAVNRIPFGDGTNPFQSDADLTFNGSTLTLNGLADISGAAGGQIQFPATQNASAGANTLDDYEEGTWTPTDASGAGLALTATSGKYVKVGQLVLAGCLLTYPITASGAAAKIGGLPFTVGGAPSEGVGLDKFPYTAGAAPVYRFVRGGTTTIENYLASGAAYTNLQFSATTHDLAVVYRTAA